MLACPGRPATSGVMALTRNASVGWPPSGASTVSAARSASGGSISRLLVSRQAPLPRDASKASPRSASGGCSEPSSPSASRCPSAASASGPATASSVLATGMSRRRIAWAVASDVTAMAPVTCVGRSENPPSPSAGNSSVIRSLRLHESAVRRPSGLSVGTLPALAMRSTTTSPGRAPSDSARGPLIATASGASGGCVGRNPSVCGASHASSVARTGRPVLRPSPVDSSDTSNTIAGTIWSVAGPAIGDRIRAAVSAASSARKKPSDSTAA